MGLLLYGTAEAEFRIEDRTLEHLRVVALQKFRRSEPFALILNQPVAAGSGRDVLWLHPAIPFRLHFTGNRAPALNRGWIEALMLASYDANGLRLIPESEVEAQVADRRTLARSAA